jgi:hypothetical protein
MKTIRTTHVGPGKKCASIYVDKVEYAALQALAKQDGRSVSGYIRQLAMLKLIEHGLWPAQETPSGGTELIHKTRKSAAKVDRESRAPKHGPGPARTV